DAAGTTLSVSALLSDAASEMEVSSSNASSMTGGHLASGNVSTRASSRAASVANDGISGEGCCNAEMVVDTAAAASRSACTPSAPGISPDTSERLTNDSAGAVTEVISGTSVIANAPLIVCTAR